MGKTLILGANGNLGGLCADRLLGASQRTLRVATSREAGLDSLRSRFPGAEAVLADWNDERSLVAAMRGVSTLLVVVPDFLTDETKVTPNIIRAAKKVGSIELLVRFLGMPPGFTAGQLTREFLDTRCGANLHVIAKPRLDASDLPVCYVNVPGWIMFNMLWFFAAEVRARRRIAMPAVTDASRMWISEHDIADVLWKLLSEPASIHTGQEYVLTATTRYSYAEMAHLFSEELGESVSSVDDDAALRSVTGERFETLMTYFRHETQAYRHVVHRDTLAQLLGRQQQTVRDYIKANRESFL